MNRMTVYLTGPDYAPEAYQAAHKWLDATDHDVMSFSDVGPASLLRVDALHIRIAMIDAADAVYFIDGWEKSEIASLEHIYCEFIGKEIYHESDIDEE